MLKSEKLTDFIELLENALGRANKNFMPMQAGDVPTTWADTSLLEKLTGYKPRTAFQMVSRALLNGIRIIIKFRVSSVFKMI